MSVLVICAVEAERDAVVRNLGTVRDVSVNQFSGVAVDTPAGELHAFSVGVGPVAAAIGTAALLTSGPGYEMVASAGIAGGFRGRVAVGEIVLANLATFADLGARVEAGFLSLRDMGIDQDSSLALGDQRLIDRMQAGVLVGEVLTLSAMTGTDADAAELAIRYPRALAEAMEGFAVVAATRGHDGIRYVAEIRAISNLIGSRDRSTWNIPLGFSALADAMSTLLKEPLP